MQNSKTGSKGLFRFNHYLTFLTNFGSLTAPFKRRQESLFFNE